MTTYVVLRARIADELSRTDLTTNINAAILSAIAHYERERWPWNETRSNVLSTVNQQEFYTSADASWIPNIAAFTVLTATINATREPLERMAYDVLEALSDTTTAYSQPDAWAYWGNQLRFYPIPNAIYAVRFSGILPLTALSADADTNAWTTTAEDLIRHRAKWDLYLNVIMGDDVVDLAGLEKSQEREAYSALRRLATMKSAGAGIRSYVF